MRRGSLFLYNASVIYGNDIGKQLATQLRDPANLDFRPKADSDLVDTVTPSGTVTGDEWTFTPALYAGGGGTETTTLNPTADAYVQNTNLSGTPTDLDVGVQQFTVKVQDQTAAFNEATMAVKVQGSPDINRDGSIDIEDLATIAANWNNPCTHPTWCQGTDLNINGTTEIQDLRQTAKSWLEGATP